MSSASGLVKSEERAGVQGAALHLEEDYEAKSLWWLQTWQQLQVAVEEAQVDREEQFPAAQRCEFCLTTTN